MNFRRINIKVASVIAALILFYNTNAPYGSYPHFLAAFSSVFVFHLIFDLIKNKQLKKVYIFPFLFLNWLYFQSPFLLNSKTYYIARTIKDEYIHEIATYTFFSIPLIYIGYLAFFNKSVFPLSSTSFKFSNLQLKKLIKIFVVLSIIFRIGKIVAPQIVETLSNLIQIVFYSPTIALALYTIYILRNPGKFKINSFHVFVLLFFCAEFLIRLSTTLFAQVGVFVVGAILAYFIERKKIPLIWMVSLVLILTPLYQARKYFRNMDALSNTEGFSLEFGLQIFQKVLFGEDDFDYREANQEANKFSREHNRFENLSFIAHVVHQHKTGTKDFLYGETFYWLPVVPIPRIIFPFKPVNEMASTKSTEYGVRARGSRSAINFPMLIESYINFGFNGVLIMALLFGMSYKWFVMKFGAGIGDLNLLMIINVFKQFTHAEGNITLVFGALIQVFVFWWFLVKVFNLNEMNQLNQANS